MRKIKIQTGIRFEPELLYKITEIAKDNRRSFNAQMEYLAQECVKEYEKTNGPRGRRKAVRQIIRPTLPKEGWLLLPRNFYKTPS